MSEGYSGSSGSWPAVVTVPDDSDNPLVSPTLRVPAEQLADRTAYLKAIADPLGALVPVVDDVARLSIANHFTTGATSTFVGDINTTKDIWCHTVWARSMVAHGIELSQDVYAFSAFLESLVSAPTGTIADLQATTVEVATNLSASSILSGTLACSGAISCGGTLSAGNTSCPVLSCTAMSCSGSAYANTLYLGAVATRQIVGHYAWVRSSPKLWSTTETTYQPADQLSIPNVKPGDIVVIHFGPYDTLCPGGDYGILFDVLAPDGITVIVASERILSTGTDTLPVSATLNIPNDGTYGTPVTGTLTARVRWKYVDGPGSAELISYANQALIVADVLRSSAT